MLDKAEGRKRQMSMKLGELQEKERQIMRQESVPLGMFRVFGVDCVFSRIVRSGKQGSQLQYDIRLSRDKQAPIRIFYYVLLKCCSDQQSLNIFGERQHQLLSQLKEFILRDSNNIEQHVGKLPEIIGPAIKSQQIKKTLLEVLQMLCRGQDIYGIIYRYPIVDTLMMALVKEALKNKDVTMQNLMVEMKIEFGLKTDRLADSPDESYTIEDKYVVTFQNEYVYIRQTQYSIQIIQPERTQISNLPTLPLSGMKGDKLFSLDDVRQCSSKRNSIEQSPRKMSGNFDIEPLTDGKVMMRDAYSERDSSNDQASHSCVIERIQFGVREADKSPPKFNKVKSNWMGFAMGIPNVGSTPASGSALTTTATTPLNTSMPHSSKTSIVQVPSLTKISSNNTIYSTNDKKQTNETEEGEGQEDLKEDLKMTICDGTTSESLLKLLNPTISKILDQKKKQSFRYAMQNFQNSSSQSTLIKNSSKSNSRVALHQPINYRVSPHRPIFQRSISKEYVKPAVISSPKIVFTYSNAQPKRIPQNRSISPQVRRLNIQKPVLKQFHH